MLQGSSSCLDLSGGRGGISNSCTNVNAFNDRDGHGSKVAMLPGYRKAPDYETAVRQKYQRHVSGSQPDVYQSSSSSNTVANQVAAFHLMRQQQNGKQKQQPPYPDVTQTSNSQQIYNNNTGNNNAVNGVGVVDQPPNRYANNGVALGGGFKMNQQQIVQQQMRMLRLSNGNMIDEIKPPPPYPNPNRLSSTSTPDLALISHRSLLLGYRGSYVSGSSPDLVSSRTALNNHHLMQLQQQNKRMSASGMTTPGYMKSTSSIGPQNYYINGAGTVTTGHHPAAVGMRHSHSILPHGTYENLNCIDQTADLAMSHSNLNLYQNQQQQQQLQSHGSNLAVNAEHMVLGQQRLMNGNIVGGGSVSNLNTNTSAATQQHNHQNIVSGAANLTTNPTAIANVTNSSHPEVVAAMQQKQVHQQSQQSLNNSGVIEPIYENLPLSCWGTTNTSGPNAEDDDNDGGGAASNSNNHQPQPPIQSQVTVTHTSASESPGNGVNLSGALAVDPNANSVSGLSSAVEVTSGTGAGGVVVVDEMRDRASSVQSAPAGGVRGSYRSTAEEDVVVSIVEERERDKVIQVKRPVSKTWSNPVDVKSSSNNNNNSSSSSSVFQASVHSNEMTSTVNNGVVAKSSEKIKKSQAPIAGGVKSSAPSKVAVSNSSNNSKSVTSLLNRSQSANLLDTSHSSQFTVDSGNISASTSNASIANTTASSGVEKKKRGIWSILSRGRGSSSSSSSLSFGGSSSSKHAGSKSATLGKSSKNLSLLTRDEEDNLKRWATGLPRMEPLSANMSKEQLGRLLEQKRADEGSLFREFERIPVRKEHAKYECALHEENRTRNAEQQCLPHDDNRVRLLPTRTNRLGYVNASHLSVSTEYSDI